MTIKKDPFKDLLLLHERMSRLFDETMLRVRGPLWPCGVWFPPVDVYETEECIVLKAELPGVDVDGITVEVEDNVLTIKGERRQKTGFSEWNYHRIERPCGAFHRIFSLPNAVNRNEITANLTDGILRVIAPKGFEPLDPHAGGSARIKVE